VHYIGPQIVQAFQVSEHLRLGGDVRRFQDVRASLREFVRDARALFGHEYPLKRDRDVHRRLLKVDWAQCTPVPGERYAHSVPSVQPSQSVQQFASDLDLVVSDGNDLEDRQLADCLRSLLVPPERV
jgi:hypothetical protein